MANLEIINRQRLDVWLMQKYPEYSRAFLQRLCQENKVLVNGQPEKAGYKLRGSEDITVLHDMKNMPKIPDIKLPVLFEDQDVIVIDKPVGVLSHGLTKFLGEPSVASFLRQRLVTDVSKTWKLEDLRFGIVHRLDRVTSGVMICAKNQTAMKFLQKQFHDRLVTKTYYAIVTGQPKLEKAILDLPLERNPKAPATWRVGANGKSAETTYTVITPNETHSLLELIPKTGRTHQLRVHLKHIGHPIVGDMLYGDEQADRLYLHASKLEITLPDGSKQAFVAPLPTAFNKLMRLE